MYTVNNQTDHQLNLFERKARSGNSQAEASRFVGCQLSTWQDWEQGRRTPQEWQRRLILCKLARLKCRLCEGERYDGEPCRLCSAEMWEELVHILSKETRYAPHDVRTIICEKRHSYRQYEAIIRLASRYKIRREDLQDMLDYTIPF